MKLTAEMLTAAFLFASIGLAAHRLIAPGKTTATVLEPGSSRTRNTISARSVQGRPGQPGNDSRANPTAGCKQ